MKDTVIADPNSVTRVLVHFPTADDLGFDPDATFPAAVSLGGHIAGDPHGGEHGADHAHGAGHAHGGGRHDTAAHEAGSQGAGGHGGAHAHGPEPRVDRLGGDYIGSVAPPAAHHRKDTLQGYVWHCHILDHEDHDMMLRYRTVT